MSFDHGTVSKLGVFHTSQGTRPGATWFRRQASTLAHVREKKKKVFWSVRRSPSQSPILGWFHLFLAWLGFGPSERCSGQLWEAACYAEEDFSTGLKELWQAAKRKPKGRVERVVWMPQRFCSSPPFRLVNSVNKAKAEMFPMWSGANGCNSGPTDLLGDALIIPAPPPPVMLGVPCPRLRAAC